MKRSRLDEEQIIRILKEQEAGHGTIALFFWQPLDGMGRVLLILLGAAFALAQITLIAGLLRTPLPVAASLNYVQIIAAVAFGAAVFGELQHLMSWAGTVLIVGAGLYMIRHRTKGIETGVSHVHSATD